MTALDRRTLLQGLSAAAFAAALGGCVQNQALGRSQVMLVSDGQLAQLSAASWRQLVTQKPVSRDPRWNARVGRVGQRIVDTAGLGGRRWEYAVFEDDSVNAFVLPGGQVGFNTGILELMENDDQLAVVMSHEIAHVIARHAAERYSQSQLANLGLAAVGAGLGAGGVANAGDIAAVLGAGVSYGVILPYSRQHELEADTVGLRIMNGAGYDIREARTFWTRMAQTPGRPRVPEMMSTHPSDTARMQNIEQQLRQLGVAVLLPGPTHCVGCAHPA